MTVDELSVLITANSEQFQKELGKVTSSISNMTKSAKTSTEGITKAFGVLKKGLVALGIGKVIKDSISTAMETVESDNLFGYVLGNMAKETYEWSNEVSKALGLSAVAVRKNTGTIYSMTTSMGIAGDTALDMAKGVAMLANDMSAFYNIDSELAFSKIQSGLTGMSVPLKELGILIDDEIIKETAYKKGIAQTGTELTSQQKVLARYVAILEQTRNAQGALSREMNTPANLIRRLKTEISNCANTIGTILMPIVSKALVYINAFVKVLSNALSSLASFLGFKSSLADDTLKASSNIGDLAGSMDDADKSAKSIKKSLAGFDEITNLATPEAEADTSGVDASGIPIGFNLGDYDAGLDNIEDRTKNIVDKITMAFNSIKIKKIDFTPMTKALNKLEEALKPFDVGIWDGLKWGIENVLSPLANFTIEDAIPSTLNLISGALNGITGNNTNEEAQASPIEENATGGDILGGITSPEPIVIDVNTDSVDKARDNIIAKFDEIREEAPSLGATLSAIWDTNPFNTFFGALGSAWNLSVEHITRLATTLCTDLKGTWDKIELDLAESYVNLTELWELFWHDVDVTIQTWGDGISKKITGLFDTIYKTAFEPFVVLAKGIWKDFTQSLTTFWEEWGAPITNKIGEAIDGTIATFQKLWDSVVAPILEPFFKAVGEWWEKHGKPLVDKILNFVGTLTTGLLDLYNRAILPVVNFILEYAKPKIESVAKSMADTMNTIWGVVSGVIGRVMTSLSGLVNFIVGVLTLDWERAWNGIKDTFKGVVESFNGIFKGVVNLIVDKINKFIRGLNSISIDLPEALGGFHVGFNIKELPKLARGGIVDSPTIAMIGERGREAVVPLENNTEWLDKLASKLFTMLNAVRDNNNDRPINVTVTSTLNGKVVSKELIRDLNKEAKRLGYKEILAT